MKFYGAIGYIWTEETRPGVWTKKIEERVTYGDILSNVRRWEPDNAVNEDVTTTNRISVIADNFLCQNMGAMAYIEWNGTVWKIKSVELVRPRAIISLGGQYLGERKNPEEETPPDGEEEPDEPVGPDTPDGEEQSKWK